MPSLGGTYMYVPTLNFKTGHSVYWCLLPEFNYFAEIVLVAVTVSTDLHDICHNFLCLNPLGPKRNQHQFSPKNISISSRVQVTRITKLITKGRML